MACFTKASNLFRFLMFLATVLSTCLAGAILSDQFKVRVPTTIFYGWPYSVAIMSILGLHEFGHYFAAKLWKIKNISLPLFLPAPFTSWGTFGALISLKDNFPNRRALFDIAVAGPWCGLVAVWYFYSILRSGLPKFFPLSAELQIFFAMLTGIFVTFINLFPLGVLDGGRVLYAVFGADKKKRISFLIAAMVYAFFGQTTAHPITFVFFALLFGIGHPPTENDEIPLDNKRKLMALLTLIVFLGLNFVFNNLIKSG